MDTEEEKHKEEFAKYEKWVQAIRQDTINYFESIKLHKAKRYFQAMLEGLTIITSELICQLENESARLICKKKVKDKLDEFVEYFNNNPNDPDKPKN